MTISAHLGYLNDALEPPLTPSRLALCNVLVGHLDSINAALAQNSLDSMAVSVGELQTNYGLNINAMKAEGTRLLRQLSQIAGLPIIYDPYLAKYTDLAALPLAIRQYLIDQPNLAHPYFVDRDGGLSTGNSLVFQSYS